MEADGSIVDVIHLQDLPVAGIVAVATPPPPIIITIDSSRSSIESTGNIVKMRRAAQRKEGFGVAVLLCVSAAWTGASALVVRPRPASPIRRHVGPCVQRGRPSRFSRLFVQARDNAVLASAENDALDDADSTCRPKHVYTTSEEAAVFLADVPSTSSPASQLASSEKGSLSTEGLLWRGVVVVLCALWGSNFASAKLVLEQPGVDASLFGVARFSLAALSLLPGTLLSVRKGSIDWETAKGAMVCGSWVAFGYLGQLIGLTDTTPSRSCVICSLNCIFVAMVAEIMRVNSAGDRGYATSFHLKKLVPALIAVVGVAIIEWKGAAGSPTMGDVISFSQPIGFGMGYLQLEELMKKRPSAALPVSAIKLAVVASAALVYFELSPHASSAVLTLANNVAGDAESIVEATKGSFVLPDFSPVLASPIAMGAILYTGIVTTSIALWVESIAFQRVPATDASIILTTEPLFAAAVSAFLVGETFGYSDAVGAIFIVGACIYAIKMGDSKEVCDETTKECFVVD